MKSTIPRAVVERGVWEIKVFKNNLNKLLEVAEKEKLETIIVFGEANLAYLTSYRGYGFLVIKEEQATLYVPLMECLRALDEASRVASIKAYTRVVSEPLHSRYGIPVVEGRVQDIVKQILANAKGKVGITLASIPASTLDTMIKSDDKKRIVDISEKILALRSVKEEWEVNMIREATRITEKAIARSLDYIREGMRDYELAGIITREMYWGGAQALAFNPIVAIGPNSAYPHAYPSGHKVRKHSVIVIDVGCIYKNYCSDMTRTVLLNPEKTEMLLLEEVELAYNDALSALKHGVEASEPYAAALRRFVLRRHQAHFTHSLGHGLGVEVHEKPTLSLFSEEKLARNMVVTVEPGLYFPGAYGFRIENPVVITENGALELGSLDKIIVL